MRLAKSMVGVAAAGAAASALNRVASASAESRYPPEGRFVDVSGLSVHVVERGAGGPVLYLHGNGGSTREVAATGLIEALSPHYRVIVPDRPGFGHTTRPDQDWTPERQADLFAALLGAMNAAPALVIAHSWGALVATALAIRHPQLVRGLVLVSGYYYPVPRADAALAVLAAPLAGSLLRYTAGPALARLAAPLVIARVFAPNPVTARFEANYPVALAARPSQLRALGEENGMMLPAAARLSRAYDRITCPVFILAGADDRIVDPGRHSAGLVRDIPRAGLAILPGVGHMLPHIERQAVLRALASVARDAARREVHRRARAGAVTLEAR